MPSNVVNAAIFLGGYALITAVTFGSIWAVKRPIGGKEINHRSIILPINFQHSATRNYTLHNRQPYKR